jgi:predicted PurR-regulated permease PerM
MNLKQVAKATAVALGIVALAVLVYFLLDILLLFFLGIVVAAALQPWHTRLCRWGVPKGPAVLLIYAWFLACLVVLGLFVVPAVVEEVTTLAAGLPEAYARVQSALEASRAQPLRLIAHRLPPLEMLTALLTGLSSTVFQGVFGFTSTVLGLIVYVLSVLAIALYWTMELPRVERFALSFVPVVRRAKLLSIWHEIEYKLGAFMRAQGIAMLAIGVASAIGYAVIGLPNVLVLAVLAGLLEAVPLVGPVLAAIPAVLVALPLGVVTVLWVIGLAAVLQALENNILIPRLMNHAVGVSPLVGLMAVLAFGTLYGVLGVLIAIPLTAIIQVLIEQFLINIEIERVEGVSGRDPSFWVDLGARVRGLRQLVRSRLRTRGSRMGIDPGSADHVVDALDQQLEGAIERVKKVITAAECAGASGAPTAQVVLVNEIQGVAQDIEEAIGRVDDIVAATQEMPGSRGTAGEVPFARLCAATVQVERAIECVEEAVGTTQGPPARTDPDRPMRTPEKGRA